MLALMYAGIEAGTLETIEQKEKEQAKNVEGLIGMFGVNDRSKK